MVPYNPFGGNVNPYGAALALGGAALAGYRTSTRLGFRGSGGGQGANTQVRHVGIQKKRRKASFRDKVLKNQPAKHFSFGSGFTLLQHQIQSLNITAGVTQGTALNNRLGDSIELCALKVKGHFYAPATADAYNYRIIVGWSGEEYGATGFGVNLTDTEIFLPNTTPSSKCDGLVNPKAFTVLHDQTMDVNSNVPATSDIYSFGFTIPFNKQFDYQSNGSIFGKSRSLYCVVIGDSFTGAVGATVAIGQVSWDLIFK